MFSRYNLEKTIRLFLAHGWDASSIGNGYIAMSRFRSDQANQRRGSGFVIVRIYHQQIEGIRVPRFEFVG